ncbi:MAG: hypothetical protein DRQ56_04320 [Gammaproteobacteria bacterium]|nr:MAG: hypothetical protein DRQ56_04320 [Gammaproteobacteria bacterium]
MRVNIGNAEREVKFNFNVISFFCRLNRVPFTELLKLVAYDPIGLTRDMVYSSLKVYPDNNPEHFNVLMVGDWLEDITDPEMNDLQLELIKALGLNEGKENGQVKKKMIKK